MLRIPLRASKLSLLSTFKKQVLTPFAIPSSRYYSSNNQQEDGKQQSHGSSPFPMLLGGVLLACVAGGSYYYFNSDSDKAKKRGTLGLEPLDKNTTVVFVLGGPGAGKGTQCAKVVKDYGFEHLSAGDLLRAEQKVPNSKNGELIKEYIKEGKIVPMEITIALLHQAMKNSKNTRFLIDGFPRAMDQALKFEEEVCESKMVLYFECPEAEMLKRLMKRGETSGRSDDNVESIKKRFRTFADTSYPVIEYFQKHGKVKKVSCQQSVDQVYAQTRTYFDELLKK